MGDETLSVKEILLRYRDYLQYEADEREQKAEYWGEAGYKELEEQYEHQLWTIEPYGLLDEVETDFGNLNELYDKSVEANKRVKDNRIDAKLKGSVAASGTSTGTQTSATKTSSQQPSSVLLSHILEEYVKHNEGEAKARTAFMFLIDVVGDIPVSEFNKDNVRIYIEKLNKKTRISSGQEVPISPITKNDHINACKRIMAYAKPLYQGLDQVYFDDPSLKFRVKKADRNKRVPYSDNELIKMFTHQTFTKGVFRHPYEYWAPLIALLLGCRANEIAQLHVDDIKEENGIFFIAINMDTEDKKIKTDIERVVPLHPKLIELGFLDFVKAMGQPKYKHLNKHKHKMLFIGLSEDKGGRGYQKNLSRWFNNKTVDKKSSMPKGFKYRVGITIPKGTKKDFHNFRHTCSTRLENAGVPNNIGYWITGHSINDEESKLRYSAGGVYRHGVELSVLYDNICKMNLDDILENVRPFFDICDKRRLKKKAKLKDDSLVKNVARVSDGEVI